MVQEAAAIWRQTRIPVVFRDAARKRLLVKLPYTPDNREWLRADHPRRSVWLKQYGCWEVPRAWLDTLIQALCDRHGQVYVIQPYREREVCAPACWQAEGQECACSCLGANHGQGDGGAAWYVVSDAFAVCWGAMTYGCRLLTWKESA